MYTAVIVEPRRLKAMRLVLRNFTENLNSKWNFLIFHGTENEEWVKRVIQEEVPAHAARFSFENLGKANLTVLDYNQLRLSKGFWMNIPTETCLLFEADSLISSRKQILQKFLQYDYVGAPWKWGGIGNGGLSLRKKSKMLECLKKFPDVSKYKHEDSYFAQKLKKIPHNLPTEFDAQEFSVETVYRENAFGIHACWKHIGDKLPELYKQFPELQDLIEQQGVIEPQVA